MNKTDTLIDRLRELAGKGTEISRTLIQAADMIENQARHIEALQTALAIEHQNHDRLQDWDRGLTEQGEVLKRLINGVWKYGREEYQLWSQLSIYPVTHWMPLPEPPKEEV